MKVTFKGKSKELKKEFDFNIIFPFPKRIKEIIVTELIKFGNYYLVKIDIRIGKNEYVEPSAQSRDIQYLMFDPVGLNEIYYIDEIGQQGLYLLSLI